MDFRLLQVNLRVSTHKHEKREAILHNIVQIEAAWLRSGEPESVQLPCEV